MDEALARMKRSKTHFEGAVGAGCVGNTCATLRRQVNAIVQAVALPRSGVRRFMQARTSSGRLKYSTRVLTYRLSLWRWWGKPRYEGLCPSMPELGLVC